MATEISNSVTAALSPKVVVPEPPKVTPRQVQPESEATEKQQGAEQVKAERLEVKVSNLNDYVQNIDRSIQFSVSEETGRTIIRVYNAETDELIREIPPEEMQHVSETLHNLANGGLLLKTRV